MKLPWRVELESGIAGLLGYRGAMHDGTAETPSRVVRALLEMTRGYDDDPATILARDFDGAGYDQIVALGGIEFQSLCEHHALPFRGTADVAYLPGGKVVGLSKLARLVDCYARRFQMQERLTRQVADALEQHLAPRGVLVVVRGEHACMTHRGVAKPGAVMVTSDCRGALRDDPTARAEALALISQREI